MTDPITQAVARLSKSTAPKMDLYDELCRVVRREQERRRVPWVTM